jgi:AcrR family transcriptional regulator
MSVSDLAEPPGERVLAAATAVREGVRREGGLERPLGKKAARTRLQLLAAAFEVFSAQGYQATSVSDIADAAGVSLGAFYQYFRDRSDIMTTLVGTRVLELLEGSRRRWEPARGRLGLRRVIAGFVETYAASPRFQAVWEEVTHVDPEMAALRRDLTNVFTSAVERALVDGAAAGIVRDDLDPAGMARALTSMVDRHCYVTWVLAPPEDAPSVDDTVDLLTGLWADAIGLVESGAQRR